MALFDTIDATLQSVSAAQSLLSGIRGLYRQAKGTQTYLQLYAANTDPKFNAAVNTLFSAAERSELNAMLTQINTLIADWEANHKAPLGLP
jgi:hypothetical protein